MVIQVGKEPDPAKRIRVSQGKRLRRVRKLRQISAHDFAKALDVTDGAVYQWETGLHTPRQSLQVQIAHILDVPWSSIFGLDEVA